MGPEVSNLVDAPVLSLVELLPTVCTSTLSPIAGIESTSGCGSAICTCSAGTSVIAACRSSSSASRASCSLAAFNAASLLSCTACRR
eukprot:3219191-Amphidinium_carterae.1